MTWVEMQALGNQGETDMDGVPVCIVEGCGEPRKRNVSRGGYWPLCDKHQKAAWNNKSQKNRGESKRRSRKPVGNLTPRPPLQSVEGEKEKKMTGPKPPRLEDLPVRREEIPTPQPPPQSVREGEQNGHECEGCEVAEMLALIRVMYPEVDVAVAVLHRERAAKQKLKELGLL